VARPLVERILDLAARAPSGTNMQPWRVHALAGAPLALLSSELLVAHDEAESGATVLESPYRYYPSPLFEPYLARRRKVGWDMYGLLGIAKGDKARMHAQHGQNFRFFGAPVGLIVTIDRRLEIGSWIDIGMFLQGLAIAARAHRLETCPQAAFAPHTELIRKHVPMSETEIVVCGVALGRADSAAAINTLRTEREPASAFASFAGF
jgi:nitroreductase